MATLVYSDVDGVDRSFALGSEPVTIGRAPECAIRSEDPRVSRIHARFFIEQGVLWVEDAGSSNGIYVGPNKVKRAPVPTGEIILVGSLMIRLLPSSGTLPPPVGLHGTLATWLEMERKYRVSVEDERDAFAKRVGELHQQLAAAKALVDVDAATSTSSDMKGIPELAEAVRLRDEAEAKVAMLESALAAVQTEVGDLRKSAGDAKLRGELDEAESARSIAEHAAGEAMREAQQTRDELDKLRRSSSSDLESVRLDLAKLREAKMVGETQGGIQVAERLAETDMVIANLQRDLAEARKAATAPNTQIQPLADQVTTLTGRLETAEKQLASAQIRAQGAERNLSHATAMTAKSEGRVAQIEARLTDAEERAKTAEQKRAEAAERVTLLESRLGSGTAAPLQAAEARANKAIAELAEGTLKFEAQRDKFAALEKQVADAQAALAAAEASAAKAKADVGLEAAKAGDVGKRAAELEARIATLAQAETAIAQAIRQRDEAVARAQAAERKVSESLVKVDESDKRSTAAETMAKAMAKDVAEALRRAAEADSRARGVNRELADSTRRAEEAEAKAKDIVANFDATNRRATDAEAQAIKITEELTAKLAETEAQLGAKAAQVIAELGTKVEASKKEIGAKLEQTLRDLAAERSTSLQLVERKTQLERELADLKLQVPSLAKRAEAAEAVRADLERQIDELQDHVDDLESGLAVAETAHAATSTEVREKVTTIERELITAKTAGAKSAEAAESLRVKLKLIEGELQNTDRSRTAAEAGLEAAKARIVELEQLASDRATAVAESREKLDAAIERVKDIETRTEGLSRSAEAADLAIGRAGALQRQLDEAISKLAWLERELAGARSAPQAEPDTDAIDAAEARARAAEDRAHELEARARAAEDRVRAGEARETAVIERAKLAEQRANELELELGDFERNAEGVGRAAEAQIGDADRRVAEAERRASEAERRIADAERRAQDAEARVTDVAAEKASRTSGVALDERQVDRKLFEATKRIADLEREVARADNVRSFAVETEREIAQLQRDLRETRTKVTQLTLERDRMESELRDVRDDSDTTNRAVMPGDRGEARYETAMAKAAEAEHRTQQVTRDNTALKKHIGDLEARLEQVLERLSDQEEATATGNQLPLAEVAEHVSVLEESIDSLRSNMRAASDETALMDQTDSVIAVSSAVSQAAEHIERARAAIRALLKTIQI